MAYEISGPVNLGTASTATQVLGNITLPNTTSAQGDTLYAGPGQVIQALPIGTAGYVLTSTGTIPAWQPSSSAAIGFGFCAKKNGVQTIPAGTPINVTTWTTSGNGCYDNSSGAFNITTGIFTVPVSGTGKYHISAGVGLKNSSNGSSRIFQIRVSGSNATYQEWQPTGSISIPMTQEASIDVLLNAGAQVSLQVGSAGAFAGTIDVQTGDSTWFSIFRFQ